MPLSFVMNAVAPDGRRIRLEASPKEDRLYRRTGFKGYARVRYIDVLERAINGAPWPEVYFKYWPQLQHESPDDCMRELRRWATMGASFLTLKEQPL